MIYLLQRPKTWLWIFRLSARLSARLFAPVPFRSADRPVKRVSIFGAQLRRGRDNFMSMPYGNQGMSMGPIATIPMGDQDMKFLQSMANDQFGNLDGTGAMQQSFLDNMLENPRNGGSDTQKQKAAGSSIARTSVKEQKVPNKKLDKGRKLIVFSM